LKRIVLLCVVPLLFCAGTALAKDISIDISGGKATGPEEQYGSAFGYGLGTSISLASFLEMEQGTAFHHYGRNIAFRADIHSYRWDGTRLGVDVQYKRLPLFLGGRYYFPLPLLDWNGWKIYGEGGLEVSHDQHDSVIQSNPAVRLKDHDTNAGASFGAGMLFHLTETIYAGLGGRFHVIIDPYATAELVLGVYLPY